ncbi:MAG: EAL domain-containing protein [Mogibacterium sp.]|nr:EAL domain-containing protein [Mogibacterium sp.]
MSKYQFSETEQNLMERSRIPFAVYQFINKRVVTLVLSDGFLEQFGYTDRAQAMYDMDNDMYKDAWPEDISRVADAAVAFATGGKSYDVIYRTKCPDSSDYMVIHARGEHIELDDGSTAAQVWYTKEGMYSGAGSDKPSILMDSLDNAMAADKALIAGYYDYLTGLPSMTYFFELAETGIARIREQGAEPSLLFLDLSGLKYYNRWHGFAEGDKLLRGVANILVKYFGGENCSRFGQDHFVALAGAESASAAGISSRSIEDILHDLFIDCSELNNGVSLPVRVGIYQALSDETDISIACDRAKIACDTLRDTYVSGYCRFSSTMQDDVERQQYIVANIDRAIEEGWITVYFQPIVRAMNGRVCDEEALARWIDPELGFLSPGEFIPALEDSQQIYKLDLYVLDQVLKKLDKQQANGLHQVPQSINLSRSDFEACDIVEEIRRRVDEAGISRSLITIEITESLIGSDFDSMKKQVESIRELGFPVWMDDFGSGYSSLDVLQSIRFDLIKFDMRFMQQFDSGDSNRIILTELMKMATSLGVDTVCEGVETKEQVQFLQEIGCCKLQGFYFLKPIPMEEIFRRYEAGMQIGFENPVESAYFDAIGRINLYDLAVLTGDDDDAFHNYFNTLPMAIIEVKDGKMRFVRSNQSYRDFTQRMFGTEFYDDNAADFASNEYHFGAPFIEAILECCESGHRSFVDETMPDGSIIHSFVRRIAVNPVTGTAAITVAVLSVQNDNEGTTYENIARALAANYFNIFYVDLETEHFIEYSSEIGVEGMSTERRGEDFFNAARRDAARILYKEDRRRFISEFTKENVIRTLDEEKVFSLNYRLEHTGVPTYVNMKAVRMQGSDKYIIIGVSDIDSQIKQKDSLEKIQQEQIIYSRLVALSGDYLALYTVDPETGHYTEYNVMSDYEGLGLAKSGADFFGVAAAEAPRAIFSEDLPEYRKCFTPENVRAEIDKSGIFVMHYRLMIDATPMPVTLRAAIVNEPDGDKLIVGVHRND